jgi:hypothetical protein
MYTLHQYKSVFIWYQSRLLLINTSKSLLVDGVVGIQHDGRHFDAGLKKTHEEQSRIVACSSPCGSLRCSACRILDGTTKAPAEKIHMAKKSGKEEGEAEEASNPAFELWKA